LPPILKSHDYMNEIKRESYLQQLASWKDKQIIKVITGIRRSGKSTLLMQFQKELLASGIQRANYQYPIRRNG